MTKGSRGRQGGSRRRKISSSGSAGSGAAASSSSSNVSSSWGPHPPASPPPAASEGLSATGLRGGPGERARAASEGLEPRRGHVLPSDYLGVDLMIRGTREVTALKRRHSVHPEECTPQEAQIWALGYGASHFEDDPTFE